MNATFNKLNPKLINVLYLLCLWGIAVLAYVVMTLILNRGVSCDEGYYLLGYLPGSSKAGVSDFHQIVSTLFGRFYGDNPDMFLRIARYVLTFLSALFLALGIRHFVCSRYGISASFCVPLILIASAVSFCFASPILYYDNIQMLFYLLIFAAFFGSYKHNTVVKLLCGFAIGFLFLFLLTNHLPSGILAVVAIWVLGAFLWQKDWSVWLSMCVGIIVSVVIYQSFFTPLPEWLARVQLSMQGAKVDGLQHDNASLISSMLLHISKILVLMLVSGALYGLLLYGLRKWNNSVSTYVLWILRCLLVLISLVLVLKFKWTVGSYIFYAMFAAALADCFFASDQRPSIRFVDVILVIAFLLLPFAAVFGTNMPLHIRSLMFVPFVMAAFVIILKNRPQIKAFYVFWCALVCAEMVMLMAVMDRYEYYGSPHKAACVKMETPRLNDVFVTRSEKDYFENVYHQLLAHGFRTGDAVLSSDENFIGVYAAGGVADGRLHYDLGQMCHDPNSVTIPAPRFIIMYRRYYDMVYNFAHDLWGFPENYEAIELGKFAANLPDNCISTLYVLNDHE